jgi:hypothetical protein
MMCKKQGNRINEKCGEQASHDDNALIDEPEDARLFDDISIL